MGYDRKIKDEAFGLFCLGLSFDKIVAEMKKTRRRNFSLAKKTVLEWADKDDWKTRREMIWSKAEPKRDAGIVESLADVVERLGKLANEVEAFMPQAKAPTITALSNSLLKIFDRIAKYKSLTADSGVSMAQAARLIFDIIEEDEEGREYLQRKQTYILERLESKVREAE